LDEAYVTEQDAKEIFTPLIILSLTSLALSLEESIDVAQLTLGGWEMQQTYPWMSI
jgi:hypothetical protein